MRSLRNSAGRIFLTCATLVGTLAGAGGAAATTSTYDGPTVKVGNGIAYAYVTAEADGTPRATGIRMSANALDGLTDAPDVAMQQFRLALPQDAPATVFDHLTVDWNPHGHGPSGVFTKPHFDMHFYTIDVAAVGQITPMRLDFLPRASNVPAARYMPAGYAPMGEPAVLNTVPEMGLHWLDQANGVGAPGYDFQQTLLAGSWDGAPTFLEPMMARDWMLTRQDVELPISQPQAYARTGYQPTRYSVRYEEATAEYVIELGGMTMRQAS